MKYKSILVVVVSLFLVVSCKQKEDYKSINKKVIKNEVASNNNKSVHKIVVKETIDGGSYSYLKVSEGEKEYWMAVSRVNAEVGKTYYYDQGMVMKNFESKQLNRVFDEIVFADAIRTSKDSKTVKNPHSNPHSNPQKESKLDKLNLNLSKASDDIYLKDLFENKAKYAGKEIKVSGVVVKVNKRILGKNWIHIVDGTKTATKSSLTITSQELVKVGDTVTAKGSIVLDKDFGANYIYDVLLENGTFK